MKAQVKAVVVAAGASIALLGFAGAGLADPPGDLISPPNHRHFLRMPDGELVPIGPQICGRPGVQDAFNQFHYNVHHSEVPGIGDIDTLGPQDGAPGLHDGSGPEVIGVRGC
jgi:hypothetical protein